MTALGGANRATSNSISALYSNPANMSISQVYHAGAFVQIHPEARRQSYGGAIVDSLISGSGMAGGLGGNWTLQDRDGIDRQWLDVRFALAMPLGDVVFIGLGGRYVTVQQNGVGPLGQSEVSGGLRDANIIQTVTIDAGLTVRPIPELKIAITGNNLTAPDTALLPIMGGFGIGYDSKNFGISTDLTLESKTHEKMKLRYRLGGEALFADRFVVRAGYRYDQGFNSHLLCGGLGYIDQRFAVDASVRRSVTGPSNTVIVFGITAHIEAFGLGARAPDNL